MLTISRSSCRVRRRGFGYPCTQHNSERFLFGRQAYRKFSTSGIVEKCASKLHSLKCWASQKMQQITMVNSLQVLYFSPSSDSLAESSTSEEVPPSNASQECSQFNNSSLNRNSVLSIIPECSNHPPPIPCNCTLPPKFSTPSISPAPCNISVPPVCSSTSLNLPTPCSLPSGNHPTNCPLTSGNHPTNCPLTSGNHPTNCPLTSGNHPTNCPLTSGNHPTNCPLTSGNHPTNCSLPPGNHPTNCPLTSGNLHTTYPLPSGNHPTNYTLTSGKLPTTCPLSTANVPLPCPLPPLNFPSTCPLPPINLPQTCLSPVTSNPCGSHAPPNFLPSMTLTPCPNHPPTCSSSSPAALSNFLPSSLNPNPCSSSCCPPQSGLSNLPPSLYTQRPPQNFLPPSSIPPPCRSSPTTTTTISPNHPLCGHRPASCSSSATFTCGSRPSTSSIVPIPLNLFTQRPPPTFLLPSGVPNSLSARHPTCLSPLNPPLCTHKPVTQCSSGTRICRHNLNRYPRHHSCRRCPIHHPPSGMRHHSTGPHQATSGMNQPYSPRELKPNPD